MSAPVKEFRGPRSVTSELISASSALNMYAEPIEGATGYLSETDKWAKHSGEHIHQAFAHAAEVGTRVSRMGDLPYYHKELFAKMGEDPLLKEFYRHFMWSMAWIKGDVDTPERPKRTRDFRDEHGFRWIYDAGWRIYGQHPYRVADIFHKNELNQPIGVKTFYEETGILPDLPNQTQDDTDES